MTTTKQVVRNSTTITAKKVAIIDGLFLHLLQFYNNNNKLAGKTTKITITKW